MDRQRADSLAATTFTTALMSGFALVTSLLALLGLYALLSHSVSEREREVGVRLALGSTPGRLVRLIVGEGLLLAGVGVALGIAGALAATRLLRHALFGLAPTDPATCLGLALLLLAAAGLASAAPARRAARVDPARVLESD